MDQNVILVETVPLEFDLESLGCRLRIRPGQTKFMDRLSRLAEEAVRVARPKAVARLCGLTILDEEKVQVGEVTFSSPLLRQKLLDMQVLYRAFQAYTEEKVIVKEEILSLLCRVLPQSQLIRDSVVTLDGYTGFTPIQYELLELLFRCCRKVIVTVTMDPEDNPYRESVQQKLFYMSRHTVCRLIDRAAAAGCSRDEDILLKEKPMWRFKDSGGERRHRECGSD